MFDYIWKVSHSCGFYPVYQDIRLLIVLTCLAALGTVPTLAVIPGMSAPHTAQ